MNQELPRTLKVVTVWLLIGLAIFLGVQFFDHRQSQTRFRIDGDVISIERGRDGHYHWPGEINGHPVDFLIDTGATSTAISNALAKRLELPVQGAVTSRTAGGIVQGSRVQGDLLLQGGLRVARLTMVALPDLGDRPLLGMDVLGKLPIQQRDNVLTIDLRAQR